MTSFGLKFQPIILKICTHMTIYVDVAHTCSQTLPLPNVIASSLVYDWLQPQKNYNIGFMGIRRNLDSGCIMSTGTQAGVDISWRLKIAKIGNDLVCGIRTSDSRAKRKPQLDSAYQIGPNTLGTDSDCSCGMPEVGI